MIKKIFNDAMALVSIGFFIAVFLTGAALVGGN